MQNRNSFFTKEKVNVFIGLIAFCLIYFFFIQSFGLTYPNAIIDSISLGVFLIPTALLIGHIQTSFHSTSPLNMANIGSLILFSAAVIFSNHYTSVNLVHSDFKQIDILQYAFIPKAIYTFFILAILLIYFWTEQQKIETEKLNLRAVEKEREVLKIELKSLQQQFQPHFLFNSLNSINALTISNPQEAQKMIHLLSQFMRGSIQENQSELVTLEEEVTHLKLYTDIEKVRFGNRLNVNYKIPAELLSKKLPHLILQPLIENAVKYGLYGNIDEVQINIEAKFENNQLLITMSNPFDSSTNAYAKGTGYGLPSVEKKMQILYNQYNLLTIKKIENIFTIELKVPQL